MDNFNGYNLIKIVYSENPIPRLPEFDEGKFVIQQKASALVSHVLDPKPGEKILDMCASPGGKTSHIAAILCISGIGLTKNRQWLKFVKDELDILGTNNISPNQVEELRKTIFQNSTFIEGDSETALIQPDIVSEGFAATIFLREEKETGISPKDMLSEI